MKPRTQPREFNIPSGHLKAHITPIEADNPSFNPSHKVQNGNSKRANVHINVNESPIVRMHCRGQLSDFEYIVVTRYRKIYEGLIGSGSSEIKERVDCTGYADVSFKNMEASEDYRLVQRHLGMQPAKVMDLVCGQGFTLTDAAREMKMRKADASTLFRAAIVSCGELWSLKRAGT